MTTDNCVCLVKDLIGEFRCNNDDDNLQSFLKEFSLCRQYRHWRAFYTTSSVFLLNLCHQCPCVDDKLRFSPQCLVQNTFKFSTRQFTFNLTLFWIIKRYNPTRYITSSGSLWTTEPALLDVTVLVWLHYLTSVVQTACFLSADTGWVSDADELWTSGCGGLCINKLIHAYLASVCWKEAAGGCRSFTFQQHICVKPLFVCLFLKSAAKRNSQLYLLIIFIGHKTVCPSWMLIQFILIWLLDSAKSWKIVL